MGTLGQGGYGEVKEVWDILGDRVLAIKSFKTQ